MSDELIDRVRTAASRLGASNSTIIRLSLLTQLPLIESGQLRLPEICSRTHSARRAATVTIIAALAAFLAGGSRPVDQSNEFPNLTYTAPVPTNSVICAGE